MAGWWKQHETYDGTYSFLDLVEVNRVLDIYQENRARATDAAQAEAERHRS
jgi:hypothetical protein